MLTKHEEQCVLRAFELKMKRKDIAYVLGLTVNQLDWVKTKNKAVPLEVPRTVLSKSKWQGRLPLVVKRIRLQHPEWTVGQVRDEAIQLLGDVPSIPSFYRFMSDSGFQWTKLTRKPLVSDRNKQKRLQFAQDHLNWSLEQWGQVWWSDETTIEAIPQKKEYRIWIQSSQDNTNLPTAPAVQAGGFKVTFWGAVSRNALGPLVPINGNLNGEKYVELLEDHFIDSYRDSGPDSVFMQDNASCHTSQVARAYFRQNAVTLLEWPPQSPDLNPIENIWAMLKSKMKKIPGFPRSRAELIARAQTCWAQLEAEKVDNTLNSMPKRMQLVLEARGASIKY